MRTSYATMQYNGKLYNVHDILSLFCDFDFDLIFSENKDWPFFWILIIKCFLGFDYLIFIFFFLWKFRLSPKVQRLSYAEIGPNAPDPSKWRWIKWGSFSSDTVIITLSSSAENIKINVSVGADSHFLFTLDLGTF